MNQPGPGPADGDRQGVSIRKVAAEAGVSIATVSRVINTPAAVAPATRARVQEVVQRLGYVPNPHAQVFAAGESKLLGISLPAFHGEFFTELLRGADAEATRLGYNLIVSTITTQPDGRRREKVLGTGLIDGLAVLIDDPHDALVKDVIESKSPAICLVTDMSAQGIDSLVLDNAKGAREAVEHLLRWVEPGRLHYVGGPRSNWDAVERSRTFEAVLREHGHQPTIDQMSFGTWAADWGKEWAIRMLHRGQLQGSGVLAGNDEIACGILRAAEAAHIWVPDQLRVVGFDDARLAQLVKPTLSSVSLPMQQLGEAAISTLVRRIEDPDAPATCIKFPTRLVIRESSTAMTF